MKPTIAELEKLINSGASFDLAPDGTVRPRDLPAELDRMNDALCNSFAERNKLTAELQAMRRAFQDSFKEPYIDTHSLNDLQMESIRRLVPKLRAAHFTNLKIRINGAWEEVECDWLKHLVLPGHCDEQPVAAPSASAERKAG